MSAMRNSPLAVDVRREQGEEDRKKAKDSHAHSRSHEALSLESIQIHRARNEFIGYPNVRLLAGDDEIQSLVGTHARWYFTILRYLRWLFVVASIPSTTLTLVNAITLPHRKSSTDLPSWHNIWFWLSITSFDTTVRHVWMGMLIALSAATLSVACFYYWKVMQYKALTRGARSARSARSTTTRHGEKQKRKPRRTRSLPADAMTVNGSQSERQSYDPQQQKRTQQLKENDENQKEQANAQPITPVRLSSPKQLQRLQTCTDASDMRLPTSIASPVSAYAARSPSIRRQQKGKQKQRQQKQQLEETKAVTRNPLWSSIHATSIKCGRTIGVIIAVSVLLCVQLVVNYYLYSLSENVTSFVVAILLSMCSTSLSVVWSFLSDRITGWEQRGRDQNKHFSSLVVKAVIFRVPSFVLLFTVNQTKFFQSLSTSTVYFENQAVCPYTNEAQQFAVSIGASLLTNMMTTLALSIVERRVSDIQSLRQSRFFNVMSLTPDFVVTENLADMILILFVVSSGCSVFPLMPLVGLVAFITKDLVDRYVWFRLSRQTPVSNNSFKSMLLCTSAFAVLFAYLNYPYGYIFIFTNWSSELNENCYMFE